MEELIILLKDNYPLIDWENEKRLLDTGELDSITVASIVFLLEDKYDIEIDIEYIQPKYFESADAIYNMLKEIKG